MTAQPLGHLKKLRLERRMARCRVATAIGVTDRTLSNWEDELTSPSLEQAKKLATVYGVDPNTIANWKQKAS